MKLAQHTTCIVRPASPEDAPEIVAVVRSGIDSDLLGATIYGCSGIARFIEDQIRARDLGSDTIYKVAQKDGQVVGCAEMRRRPRMLFLNYISVLPEFRSLGLGPKLLLGSIEDASAEREDSIALDVFEHNERARAWYERLGFEPEGLSEWWAVELRAGSGRGDALVCGWPQAVACWERFGFGRFALTTERGEYQVGMLGEEWFRVTQPDVLDDVSAIGVLLGLDSRRRVLCVAPAGMVRARELSRGTRLAGSHRLHASINTVTRLSACRLGI